MILISAFCFVISEKKSRQRNFGNLFAFIFKAPSAGGWRDGVATEGVPPKTDKSRHSKNDPSPSHFVRPPLGKFRNGAPRRFQIFKRKKRFILPKAHPHAKTAEAHAPAVFFLFFLFRRQKQQCVKRH